MKDGRKEGSKPARSNGPHRGTTDGVGAETDGVGAATDGVGAATARTGVCARFHIVMHDGEAVRAAA